MSANLLSIGAIDFGIIIDGAVVMVEGVFVFLAHKQQQMGIRAVPACLQDGFVKKISIEMGSLFLFQAIIITALIPIFAFKKWRANVSPLAYTMGFCADGCAHIHPYPCSAFM